MNELTREQVEEVFNAVYWHGDQQGAKQCKVLDGIDALRATITQQAQELEKLQGVLGANEVLIERLAAMTNARDEAQGEQVKLRSQLAASQARCREMEASVVKWQRIRKPTHGNCCTCQRCGLDHDSCRCDLDEVCDELTQLQATLTAREAERDDERRKLQDVCMAHGPALMKIHDLERELKRLKLTWTTALPTVAGWYWWKDCYSSWIFKIEQHPDRDEWGYREGHEWMDLQDIVGGEFAGPLPLPTEAQP